MARIDSPYDADLARSFELYGTFWPSEDAEENAVPGCLSYSPETGLHLHLYASLPDEDFIPFGPRKSKGPLWGMIRGTAGQRVPVSLFDQIRTNRPPDGREERQPPGHEIYHINCGIAGIHARTVASVSIAALYLSFSDFESFVNVSPLAPTPDKEGSVGVVYTRSCPVTATLPDAALEISIESRFGWENRRFDCSSKLIYRYAVELKAASNLTMPEAMRHAFTLSCFFMLCSSKAVNFRSVQGVCGDGSTITWFARGHGRETRPTFRDWILRLDELGSDRIGQILDNWFSKSEEMGLMTHVFFGELQSPSAYGDAKFFHLAGCLEALHRDVLQGSMGQHVSVADYKRTVQTLLGHVDPALPAALQSKINTAIKRANDHFYAERLDDLFGRLQPETRAFLADDPDALLGHGEA